jgi:hypothetical protein
MYSKSSVSNTITYKGTVNFKLNNKGNIYTLNFSNTGTQYLTDTIAKALCGQNISDRLPRFLNIVADNGDKKLPLLRQMVPFTGITWGDVVKPKNNGTAVLLTATILPTDKLPLSNVDSYTLELQMQSNTNETLAIIRSTPDDTSLHDMYNSLNDGTSAIVEWCMEFDFITEE